MKYSKGDWRVIRNCCIDGLCCLCRDQTKRPHRIVQGDGYSKEYAEHVAANWSSYKAHAEEMVPTENHS